MPLRRKPRTRNRKGESGITYIEIAMMMLIVGISVAAIAKGLQNATRGVITAKERDKALALARDRLEEVKRKGYAGLIDQFSNYAYPDNPDPANPISQNKTAVPYPALVPTADLDPWTPESILDGNITYWRHVVVKFVQDTSGGQALVQNPAPPVPTVVGGNVASNLMYLEVDVTWASRLSGRFNQVRLSTLVANSSVPIGEHTYTIAGSVYDASTKAVLPGLTVVAQSQSSDATFSIKSNSKGVYTFSNLPEDSYQVSVYGAPTYNDGGYTGNANPYVAVTNPLATLNLGSANPSLWASADVYKLRIIPVMGCFRLAAPMTSASIIRVSISDGNSSDVVIQPMSGSCYTCSSTTPCWFTVPNVVYPSVGTSTYRVVLYDVGDQLSATAQICVDSAQSPTGATVYLGVDPTMYPSVPCGTCPFCKSPSTTSYFDFQAASGNATIIATVYEQAKSVKSALPAADVPLARVAMYNSNTGVTLTQTVDGAGQSVFSSPPVNAQQLTFTAYMTTTGFSTDTFFIPDDIGPMDLYNISSPAGKPGNSHDFVLIKVASITGSVWKVSGISGAPSKQVSIVNPVTNWSAIVTTNSLGSFYQDNVPIEDTPYTVAPNAGSDTTVSPATRSINVAVNGVTYYFDSTSSPDSFVLTAINGLITGVVYNGSARVTTGATVIASTKDTGATTFYGTLPNTNLGGQYSFATSALSDGSFSVKVATGVTVGSPPDPYYLYVTFIANGAVVTKKKGPVNVNAGVTAAAPGPPW